MSNKRLNTFLNDLRKAEFESGPYNDEADAREVVKLLKRAYKWKSYNNLYEVCEYLGYNELEDDMTTIDALKTIINDNIDAWKREL